MFRFMTAGESHGPSLTVIVEGLPAGLDLTTEMIDRDLAQRQQGYGRGGRMQIEKDRVIFTGGVRHGQTLGSPVAMVIDNRDWINWEHAMSAAPPPTGAKPASPVLTRPRPGHADLVGALKYDRADLRDILERASARETAARVAAGAVAKVLLAAFGVSVGSWVERIGSAAVKIPDPIPVREWIRAAGQSDVRCPDKARSAAMRRVIDQAARSGDTVGGVFTVAVQGLPPGLGSHVQWDRRLDTGLAGAMLSIPAVKGVEFGLGFEMARQLGSRVHDVITFRRGAFSRQTNHAGGLEGGMTTGEPLLVRAAMKPIATLRRPLSSVEITTKKIRQAGYERSDVCAVPAAAVVGEAMVALVLTKEWVEKFGGDALVDMRASHQQYLKRLAQV